MDPVYGERYGNLYRNHWWWRAREEFLTRLLDRHVGAGRAGEVLDFGCGDGLFFSILERFGEPWGFEPDESLLSPNGPWRSRISGGRLEEDRSQYGRFGLVVALDVLEHIEAPEIVLQELVRRMKPHGFFVATVPAFQSMWTAHDDFNQHFRRYRVGDLEQLVSSCGLRVIEARYLFTWLAVAKWLTVVKERLLPTKPTPAEVPAAAVNRLLLQICRFEQRLLGEAHPPVGSSAVVVAQRI